MRSTTSTELFQKAAAKGFRKTKPEVLEKLWVYVLPVEITGYLNVWQGCWLMLFSALVEAERMWPDEPRRKIRRLMAPLLTVFISVRFI